MSGQKYESFNEKMIIMTSISKFLTNVSKTVTNVSKKGDERTKNGDERIKIYDKRMKLKHFFKASTPAWFRKQFSHVYKQNLPCLKNIAGQKKSSNLMLYPFFPYLCFFIEILNQTDMVNKVILLGYVGKDPEVRHMDNNMVVARFPLATNERWIKDGNKTEHTEWHNIVMWRGMAETAEKYIHKGTSLYIEGRLRTRSYDDKDGIKRYSTDIIADAMSLVGNKPEGAPQAASPQPALQATPVPSVETTDLGSVPDDLPF